MGSLFGMLEISRRALSASQFGVRVANHNIANMNSPGYTRQDVLLAPSAGILTVNGRVGNGVTVESIRRITDEFLATSLRGEETEFNEWLESGDILGRIEILTSIDDGSSLSSGITEFFNAFNDLSQNTEDPALRHIVVNKAIAMVVRFQDMAEGLGEIHMEIDERIDSQTAAVNSLLGRVAVLNGQVVAAESGNNSANDLRTERDGLLSELATFVDIRTSEDKFGAVDVYINGKNVVHRGNAERLEAVSQPGKFGEERRLRLAGDDIDPSQIGGRLGALHETRDKELASIRDALDRLASEIITNVNTLHSKGVSPAGSGIDFFTGSSAIDIDVHQLLQNEPQYVAASYSGAPGDNSLANDLALLGDRVVGGLGDKSFVGFFGELVGNIGALSQTATNMTVTKGLTTGALRARLESIAGVSLDEELSNIARYQTAFEAAANVTRTVNEMIDTVLLIGAR